jgi:HIP---CoA ligase
MRADERFATIPAMALRSAERFGEAIAIVDGAVRLSFAEVADQMVRVGRSLVASGVRPGDRVALWAPNSAAWIVAALGVQACGAWLVPLNTRFKGYEAAYIIEAADAGLLLAVDSFLGTDYLEMIRSAAPDLMQRRQAVSVPPPGQMSSPSWDAFMARGATVGAADLMDRLESQRAADVCDVIFTSGTTGRPKGVMLRHGTSLRAFESYNAGTRLKPGDRHAVAVPFFHCFGYKAGWMVDLMVGAATYPVAVFDAETVVDLIDRERITHIGGPPTIFESILDHQQGRARDLSSLRSVVVSAAAVDPELIRRLQRDVGVEGAISGYGLTESHALVAVANPDDPPDLIATTVGTPIPDIDIQIVDDRGEPVGTGEQGELLVRGYTVMEGYLGDPEATAAAVVDGWLHTGDIATRDDRGYLRIIDRKKDIFIMGGFNVSPAEVEAALRASDKIADVAVVGAPDPDFGEVGAAFVVAEAGVKLTPDEVVAFARDRLANFKVPRRVEMVESLPRNATGKVVKAELRRRVSGERS